MSQSVVLKIVLSFVLCVFATVIIRSGPPEPSIGERIAITMTWIVGVAFMIWTIAKNAK